MVRKTRSTADEAARSPAASSPGSPLGRSVRESAQQIWLAGMGAFSKAQEEGTKVFESLVQEGLNLQKKSHSIAEDKLGEVTGKLGAMAETVTARTGQNGGQLEAIFEARTAKALNKLGVPTAQDVAALRARIDELSAQVARLSPGRGPTSTAAPVKADPKPPKAAKAAKAVKAAKTAEAAAPESAPAAPPGKAPARRTRKTAA